MHRKTDPVNTVGITDSVFATSPVENNHNDWTDEYDKISSADGVHYIIL